MWPPLKWLRRQRVNRAFGVVLALTLLGCAGAQAADLFDAARRDDVKMAREVLAGGANASERDAKGYTPLILAAYNGSQEVVKLLLEKRVDVHVQNAMGNALMAAAFKGEAGIVTALLDAGARVNDVNQSGGTALMFAAMSARTEVVRMLLAHGADAALRDKRGLDAAGLADQQGSHELAGFLRDAAAKR